MSAGFGKYQIRHYISPAGNDIYQEWFLGLKDVVAQSVIVKRLDRVAEGLIGDHRYVGEGVWELRIHFGPGYRIYFGQHDAAIVLLLLGGDKGSQKRDIVKARELWLDYGRRI